MKIYVLTDRPSLWTMSLGVPGDVSIGRTLPDPWLSGRSALIVDTKDSDMETRATKWIDQSEPRAILHIAPLREELLLSLSRKMSQSAGTLYAERYGALVSWSGTICVSAPKMEWAPEVTHGPGTRDKNGKMVLWHQRGAMVGVPVSRDDPAVINSVYRSVSGRDPLWVQPGFPAKISNNPTTYIGIDGRPVSGVLCPTSDPDRIGGWDVLEFDDVALLMGYEKNPFQNWSEMASSFPAAVPKTLIRWARKFNPDL